MESQQANTFCIQHISEIRKTINDEKRKQTHLSKKYHTGVKAVTIVDDVLAGFTMVLGSVGITLLSTTAVTSPIIIAIEATALTAGIIRVAGSQANKRLSKKVEKNEKLMTNLVLKNRIKNLKLYSKSLASKLTLSYFNRV